MAYPILHMLFNFRGYYSFLHELSHIFGATHNRETGAKGNTFSYGYGKLIKKGKTSRDGYRTIMA